MNEVIELMELQNEQLKVELEQAKSLKHIPFKLKTELITNLTTQIIKNNMDLSILKNSRRTSNAYK